MSFSSLVVPILTLALSGGAFPGVLPSGNPSTDNLGRGEIYTGGFVARHDGAAYKVIHVFYKSPASGLVEIGDSILKLDGAGAGKMSAAAFFAATVGETTRPIRLSVERQGKIMELTVPRDTLHEILRKAHWHWRGGGLSVDPRKHAVVGMRLPPDLAVPGLDGKSLPIFTPGPRFTLVQFWSTWFPPSWTFLSQVSRQSARYGTDLRVVTVALWDDPAIVRKYLDQNPAIKVPIGVLENFESPVPDGCNLFFTGIPAYLLLDADGKIVSWGDSTGIASRLLGQSLRPIPARPE